ncbi:hypothetical protein IFO70_10245 [Phormidium tenue FACHB-886]|nr:hypothetical protein [Phormidium tenue FACHB-886]
MRTKVSIWVREIPLYEQVIWCFAMVTAIALISSLVLALWQFGTLGGMVIGFALCRLLQELLP